MAHALNGVEKGRSTRLVINVPPRHLKSITASVAWAAFLLGRDPTLRIICISYSEQLAKKHANDTRRLMQSSWYRGLFPATRISRDKDTELEFETTAGGGRYATSTHGTLTGRGGGLIIIDDPIKPQDAASEASRERVHEWFANTLLSRLDDKVRGKIVLVMQRLHVDDLAGRVLQSGEWRELCLPAIADEAQTIPLGRSRQHHRAVGEALHPEREPLDTLEALKRDIGAFAFSAQYQQAPVPEGGAMIKWAWVRRYDVPPPRTDRTRIIQSWDTASKAGLENDWSVCTTWHQDNGNYYLLDVERGRYDFPTLRSRVLTSWHRWKPRRLLIEDTAAGTGLIQDLREHGCHAIPVKPEGDKATRMMIQTGKFEAGQVVLPVSAPWLAAFEAELFAFPGCKHDDQVDSVSQALGYKGSSYDASLSWVG